jgi:hypothetical protein
MPTHSFVMPDLSGIQQRDVHRAKESIAINDLIALDPGSRSG